MCKILEGIYAYICQSNCTGNCSPMDKIYTLTKDASPNDSDMLSSAIQTAGRVELAKVDSKYGVRLQPDSVSPNFDISSFSYFPKINDTYSALCCSTLRKSLKKKSIRGSKELSHFVLFDNIPDGMYAVDLIAAKHFDGFKDIKLKDIKLNESNSTGNDDLICEVEPVEMDCITFDEFPSSPLKIEDITNMGRKTFERVAEIFQALIISKRDKKPLYIVYDLEDYRTMLGYLTITLKLMPANVANEYSFVTCLGKKSQVNFDIYCVPTCDKDYISTLEQEGMVIKVTGFDTVYVSEPKGAFADLLSRSKPEDFELWLSARSIYMPSVASIERMDDIAILYNNTIKKEFNVDSPNESIDGLINAIQSVSDCYTLINGIEGEWDRQISGISKQLNSALGAIQGVEIDKIKNIIDRIIDLLIKCNQNKEVVNELYGWLKNVLFGIPRQTGELEDKHFEIVSEYFKEVCGRLPDFIYYLEREWGSLSNFFNQYLQKAVYTEASPIVVLSILTYLLKDLSRKQSCMRDELTRVYLQNYPNMFKEIVERTFVRSTQIHDDEFKFVFNEALKYGADDNNLYGRIKYLVQYLDQKGLLTEFAYYIKKKYINNNSNDWAIEDTFNVLLGYYLSISNKDFASIYSAFQKAKDLVGEGYSNSLKTLVFTFWNNRVAVPNYKDAIKSIKIDKVTDVEKTNYEKAFSYLNSDDLKGIISDEFIEAFAKFIDSHTIYKKKEERARTNKRKNRLCRSRAFTS